MTRSTRWDTSYEWKVVTLLGLGFGLVGLDRWIIAPLFPAMMKDLSLGDGTSDAVGYLIRMESSYAAWLGIRPCRTGPMDHRAVVPGNDEGLESWISAVGKIGRAHV